MSVVSRQGRQMKGTGSGIVSDITIRTESVRRVCGALEVKNGTGNSALRRRASRS